MKNERLVTLVTSIAITAAICLLVWAVTAHSLSALLAAIHATADRDRDRDRDRHVNSTPTTPVFLVGEFLFLHKVSERACSCRRNLSPSITLRMLARCARARAGVLRRLGSS